MGSPLINAAEKGDIEFVRKSYEDNIGDPRSYFLGHSNTCCRNLLHAAVQCGRYTFLFEALNMLSLHPKLVIDLICQKDSNEGNNPLHCAARQGNIFILKLLVNAYAGAVSTVGNNQEAQTPPWLAKNSNENTPLHYSLLDVVTCMEENTARYLISVDEHLLRTLGQAKYPMDQCSTLILNKVDESIVFIGMKKGLSLLVEQILISGLPYAVNGQHGETPLHYASKCNEQVSRLLLGKHHELIGKVSCHGKTMLDHAVEDGATWLVRLMLNKQEKSTKCTIPYWPRVPWTKACRRLIWHVNKRGDTPLHTAARKGDIEISKLLIQGYKSALQEEAEDYFNGTMMDTLLVPGNDFMCVNPLYIENLEKNIPLILALQKKHDDCGVMLSKETIPLVKKYRYTSLYKKSLPVAMENGCLISTKIILKRLTHYGIGDLRNRLHDIGIDSQCVLKMVSHLTAKYPGIQEMIKTEEFEKLSGVFPRFRMANHNDGKTILKEAAERGEDWLVRLALESDKDLIMDSAPAWQAACEKGYLSTLLIFIELCNHQEFIKLCKKEKQTPLHHIKLLQPEQYVKLLNMPLFEELKNQIDSDGATPLHRAIDRDDLVLSKALLETNGIEVNIKDKYGTTALDLLEKKCRLFTNWGKMCRAIEQDSTVKKLKNLFRQISFEGMQNTLSMVAALVATITFAAGFTIPGGTDDKDGTPVLATKAAFLVFSISNTIAMCCSIMVLFLLLGPMMWDPHPSLFYVNLSLYLLLMSLGGTLLAFMTGVYVTMAPKAEWNAIFVIVSCSLALFMACIVVMATYWPWFKKQLSKPLYWLKRVLLNTIMKTVKDLSGKNLNTSQKPSKSLNELLTEASDDKTANGKSGSSNTFVTQSSGDITTNVQSGISNTPDIQAASSPPTERQTPSLNREVCQSFDTSHPAAPDDIKIEIKHG